MRAHLLLCAVTAVLAASGCTPDVTEAPRGTTTTSVSVSVSDPASEAPTSPFPATEPPDALLAQARVTLDGGRLRFHALWVADGNRRELVEGDGADRLRIDRPSGRQLRQAFPWSKPISGKQSQAVFGRRLLPLEVFSLAAGTRALIGGGDGATLLPFEKVARSEQYDDWSVQDLPLFDGSLAYLSGAAVLSDGRLVALLDGFSDDRRNRPGSRHHGLWVSKGADWAAYSPLRPRFVPPVPASPHGWSRINTLGASAEPDPVVWVTTWDHRLYVSRDGMRTFREVDAR